MPKFDVILPITGYAYLAVEAKDEATAIDLAMERVEIKDIQSWDPHEHIMKGNVCYAELLDAEATLSD